MPLTVRKKNVSSAQELFETCGRGDAYQYSLELQSVRYFYDQIPQKENKIGTLDATSCIGIVYKTEGDALYVQHHDGRPLETLESCIDSKHFKSPYTVQATLIGGCKNGKSNEYCSLEKHTKKNIEKLVEFWRRFGFNVDVQGWVIGDESGYEKLYSDFVVGCEGIYLIQQGEIGALNWKMKGALIPQLSRRLATILSNDRYYFVYSHPQLHLSLSPVKNIHLLTQLAQQLIALDDETLLQRYSTTPKIEPPYYSKMLREMALYILAHRADEFNQSLLLPGHSVFCIQGEIVKMDKRGPSL